MSIKITDKIIHIPPYLSTTWSHVAALQVKGDVLIITLFDGDKVEIPHLESADIETIFKHHASFVENKTLRLQSHIKEEGIHSEEISDIPLSTPSTPPPLHFAFGTSANHLQGMMMRHDPSQRDAPDLPEEILQKIALIAKVLGPADTSLLPQEEIGCNCFHCQIAKALKQTSRDSSTSSLMHPHKDEIEVTEHDLHFEEWVITQTGENLYSVVSKLEPSEKYSVYLGEPIGCTCGKAGCEHILAVLKS